MKRIVILGATGSIGRQALDVVSRHPDLFSVAGLSAHRDEAGLLAAAAEHPGAATCLSGADSQAVRHSGPEGLRRLVEDTEADVVLNAAAGAAGLLPSFYALASGKDLALANKETIVMAGRLAMEAATKAGRRILPVDSEHSALFNVIERFGRPSVRGVIITASGGAFRDAPLGSLERMTPKDALAHPTWSMGAKITIDSASMANKGLEVIEAARLFDLQPDMIRVVIHPESRVHSFVRTSDGSLYAQLSRPDMRIPILNALAWPESVAESVADMDPCEIQMHFSKPDPARYPLLDLAFRSLRDGEGASCAYNASNEEAVYAFMDGRIRFTDIHATVAATLARGFPTVLDGLDAVAEVDDAARVVARKFLKEIR
ncbi:MAG: 1-deoxy-D-xylulose-5-phosphate reductoisomerase [Spirochaetes bacterium]|nr:1-deoxy-D-xylulose-5-phosphate reductoisomerase [Spirochaetota bacterium]MBU1081356.1 1-deoxy-D-xylulose-5-phosphate reductoisomerase [Spirochaetota bacterium]